MLINWLSRTGFLLCCLAALSFFSCSEKKKQPFNVVFVVIDTLRADHCSAYGYFRSTTPHFDKLAKSGVLFENAFTQAPWTCPSMVSMFTGRYVSANYRTMPVGCAPTLAERFQAAGYQTSALVANPVLSLDSGFNRGFDSYIVADKDGKDTDMPADKFTALAKKGIKEQLKEPFFVWYQIFDPHDPYQAPPEYVQRFSGLTPGAKVSDYKARQPDYATIPMNQKIMENLEKQIQNYDGEVAFADQALGDLVQAFKEKGVWERTIFVVTTDHGEGLFDHARYKIKGKDPKVGLYMTHGEHMYEEAIRAPLLICGPGFEKNKRVPGLVELVDLFPTLLAAVGFPKDPNASGRDLRFISPKGKDGVFSFGSREISVRTKGGHKLIYPVMRDKNDKRTTKRLLLTDLHPTLSPKMYYLDQDPKERNDLSKQDPKIFKQLKNLLLGWQERSKDLLTDSPEASKEQLDRLRGLGYVK